MSEKSQSAIDVLPDRKADSATQPAVPANKVITLETPLVRGEQTIGSISLRKPRASELRGIAIVDLLRMDVAAMQVLVPRITTPALTNHDVGNLDPADVVAIGVEIAGFFMTKADRDMASLTA